MQHQKKTTSEQCIESAFYSLKDTFSEETFFDLQDGCRKINLVGYCLKNNKNPIRELNISLHNIVICLKELYSFVDNQIKIENSYMSYIKNKTIPESKWDATNIATSVVKVLIFISSVRNKDCPGFENDEELNELKQLLGVFHHFFTPPSKSTAEDHVQEMLDKYNKWLENNWILLDMI